MGALRLMQPERIEKYAIVEEIGHGGMATVYRARDTRLDRLVALKVMHPHLRGAPEARQRFTREAVTVARLKHPSILEIYDYSGDESEWSYIATELLTGPTLKDFALAHPDIPPEIAACITLELARALAAAHAEGVIHRDVKPENVLLHEAREVKLTDFGIAQLVDMQSMTATGQLLGSPGHMAPEQIEGKELGPQSDVFSLGTVLYLLATGELPFRGRNPHQILKQIVEGRFVDPLRARPVIGGRLRAILLRCLETDPGRRYATAEALAEDLAAFVREMGIDSPEKTLAEYLRDPEAFTASFRTRTIARLIELGEEAQRRRSMPTALDHYNRVLAMDERNERVLAAVRRIGRRSTLARSSAIAGAALVVAGAAVAVYAAMRVPTAALLSPSGAPTPSSSAPRTPVGSVVAPRAPAATNPAGAAPTVRATRGTETAPAQPAPPRDPGAASSRSKTPRRVTFQPFPANVSIGIDGAPPEPFGPSLRERELAPGPHRFQFVGAHECCIDETFVATIPPGPGTTMVSRKLAFRPAGLYVVTVPSVPGNVVVDDGKRSGRTRSVIDVDGLTSLVETHRIRVTVPGYRDHEREAKLTAGKLTTVEIALEKTE